jgi:hypothetical protein
MKFEKEFFGVAAANESAWAVLVRAVVSPATFFGRDKVEVSAPDTDWGIATNGAQDSVVVVVKTRTSVGNFIISLKVEHLSIDP